MKQRKKRPVLFWLLYTVIFLLMFYSVAQAQMQGYILNIQGWDSETMQVLRMVLVTIPLLVLNYFYTEMVYTAIDRLRLKKWELVLLNCRCFLAHESGAEKVAKQGYFLEGISNGVTYHFELTKRTYFMRGAKKPAAANRNGDTGRIIFDGPGKPRFFQACTKDGQKICQTRDIPEYSGDGFRCLAVLDIEISRNRALKSKQVRKKALDERDIQGFFCAIILWERKTYP